MNKEEFKKLQAEMRERRKVIEQERIQNAKKFFTDEYPTFSQADKAAYWASEFRQQMRWNGESGVNEMDALGREEYDFCEEKDPAFDALLPSIAKHLKFSLENLKKAFGL